MSVLHIECTQKEKAAWVRAAQKSPVGPALADFVRFVLNRQAEAPPILIPIEEITGLPTDWENPKWMNATKVHDWRNYATKLMRDNWQSYPLEVRAHIAQHLNDEAKNEDWP